MRSLKQRSETEEILPFFFVYGPLMTGMERSGFVRHKDKARFIATATTCGKLYEFGLLPGLVMSSNGAIVCGELYELIDPGTFFETLDLIEGFWEDEPERSLHIRKIITVQTEQGEFQAWAYVFNFPTTDLVEILSGDFRKYIQHSEPPNAE